MKEPTLFDFEPIPNKELAIPKSESTCGKCFFQSRNPWNNSLIYCTLKKDSTGNSKRIKSRNPSCYKFKPL